MPTVTIKANRFPSTGPGFWIHHNKEIVTVEPGVTVEPQSVDSGMYSDHNDSLVINNGQILSPSFNGIYLNGRNGAVANVAGARILGFDSGVVLGAGKQGLGNNGRVIGETEAALLVYGELRGNPAVITLDTTSAILDNHGYMLGGFAGVENRSPIAGGHFTNAGQILSHQYGFYISTAPGVTTTIINQAGGLISGPTASIFGNVGRFHLTNHGTLAGAVVNADGANDVIINSGAIHGPVVLGTGNSTFIGTGGTSSIIVASGGNDRIIVGNGNVSVVVGSGSDRIAAGPGDDRFIFNSMPAGQVDTINHFVPGHDKLVLSAAAFAGISGSGPAHTLVKADFHSGPNATKPAQHILYDAATGFLSYDSDGSGGAVPVHFATITGPGGIHPVLTHTDFVVVA